MKVDYLVIKLHDFIGAILRLNNGALVAGAVRQVIGIEMFIVSVIG